jgi:hypothetical protein
MKHSDVILHLFSHPNEQPSEAIQPRMGSLHHPSSRPIAGNLLLFFDFFPTTANVGSITIFLYQFQDIPITQAKHDLIKSKESFKSSLFELKNANELGLYYVPTRYLNGMMVYHTSLSQKVIQKIFKEWYKRYIKWRLT